MRKCFFIAAAILSASLATAAFAQSNTGATNSSNGAPAAAAPGTSTGSPSAPATRHRTHARHAARSNGMRRAQQALQSKGLYQGKIDGVYGPQTKAAVAQFQQQNNLKQTGRLDRATRAALRGGAPMRSGAAATPGGSGMPANATSANPNSNADARTAPSGSSMVPQNAAVPPKPNPGATQPAQ